jgi:hypothetical protein
MMHGFLFTQGVLGYGYLAYDAWEHRNASEHNKSETYYY